MMVAKELGVGERVLKLIDCISFEATTHNAASMDYAKKIVQYSDDRVSPKGVVSLEGRLQDLRDRYQQHRTESRELLDFENALREIEKQIFAKCKIKPEDVTEPVVRPIVEKLKSFEI